MSVHALGMAKTIPTLQVHDFRKLAREGPIGCTIEWASGTDFSAVRTMVRLLSGWHRTMRFLLSTSYGLLKPWDTDEDKTASRKAAKLAKNCLKSAISFFDLDKSQNEMFPLAGGQIPL